MKLLDKSGRGEGEEGVVPTPGVPAINRKSQREQHLGMIKPVS